MKAIQTKYYGPTNKLPARIKTSAEGAAAVFFSLDELGREASIEKLHERAAKRFAENQQQQGPLASGELPDGSWAHCFVPVNERPQFDIQRSIEMDDFDGGSYFEPYDPESAEQKEAALGNPVFSVFIGEPGAWEHVADRPTLEAAQALVDRLK